MKRLLTVCLCACLSTGLFSQNFSIPSIWKIKKFNVSFGFDTDMIKNLEYEYMLKTGVGVDESKYAGLDFAPEDMYGGVCENPNIRLGVTMGVPGLRNVDLNLGAMAVFNRYDGVYYNTTNSFEDYLNSDYNYLSITSMNDEIALEASIDKSVNFLRFFNLYGGLGTNIGYSYRGELQINGNIDERSVDPNLARENSDIVMGNTFHDYEYETFDLKDGLHQRVFGHLGVSGVILKRLEIGLDYRHGVGYRKVFDGPTKTTRLNSIGLSFNWLLHS